MYLGVYLISTWIDFTRQVARFSKHCAERAEAQVNPPPPTTEVASMPRTEFGGPPVTFPFVPDGGALSVPNALSTQGQLRDGQAIASGQISPASQNLAVQGTYSAQTSTDSIQDAREVQVAPSYYDTTVAKAV